MELFPYLTLCFIEHVNLIYGIYGFFLLYGFYEFGYILNDKIAVKKEKIGKTYRPQFDNFNVWSFFAIRIIVVAALIFYAIAYLGLGSIKLYCLIVLLLFVLVCTTSALPQHIG